MDALISPSLLIEFFRGIKSSYEFLGASLFNIERKKDFRLITSQSQLDYIEESLDPSQVIYFRSWRKSTFQNHSFIYINASHSVDDLFVNWKNLGKKSQKPTIVVLSNFNEFSRNYNFVISKNDQYSPPSFLWVVNQLLVSKTSNCNYLSYDIESIEQVIDSIKMMIEFQSSIEKIDNVKLISRHSCFDDNIIFKLFKHSKIKKVLYYKTTKGNNRNIDSDENKCITDYFSRVDIHNETYAFSAGHCFHDRLIVLGPFVIECTNNFENINPESDVWRIIIDYDADLANKRTAKFSENNFNLVS